MYQIWNIQKTRKFRKCLLDWYAGHRRDLPWRNATQPYHVWISEVMLQQTQVRTVVPYFEAFIRRFPDLHSLAGARQRDVLEAWAGLGYYRRARDLHLAAGRILRDHGGAFPETIEELVRLPGIGRYTAGAIRSIAFNQPAPVVDGNVRRVISRLLGLAPGVAESFFWKQAESWVPDDRPAEFNQAVMELGATICLPSSPDCARCPVSRLCAARRRGMVKQVPVRRSSRPSVAVSLLLLVLWNGKKLLVVRPKPASFVPGEWGLPGRILRQGEPIADAARALAGKILAGSVALEPCPAVYHAVTYRRIRIHVYRGSTRRRSRPPRGDGRLCWIDPAEIPAFLTSSLYSKAVTAARRAG